MATFITENGYVYYENEPEAKRELFPNSLESSVRVTEISDTDPTISGVANNRYMCGTVDTIDITPPSSGVIDVFFQSGETPTVLTIPETVLLPTGFDATSLEANTIYEIIITDGTYCSVNSWAVPEEPEPDPEPQAENDGGE